MQKAPADLLSLLWAAGKRWHRMFCERGGYWLCVMVGFHRYYYNVSNAFGRMCSTGFLSIYVQNIPFSIYTPPFPKIEEEL